VREAGEAILIAAAFVLLFFVPVVRLLLPWALVQRPERRSASIGLTVLVAAAGLTVFAWLARAMT
jgi:hypothetical protein